MKNAELKAASIVCALALVGFFAAASRAKTAPPEITRVDRAATPTENAKYPSEMVVKGDGAYTGLIEYRSEDRKFSVGLWQSEPGILKTDAYPHDEYCLVLEGNLVVTNRSGSRDEFKPGDTFVIPKGWAGTWNMTTRFKKQYVAFEPGQ